MKSQSVFVILIAALTVAVIIFLILRLFDVQDTTAIIGGVTGAVIGGLVGSKMKST
jgi:uncharacterized protein YcfJ